MKSVDGSPTPKIDRLPGPCPKFLRQLSVAVDLEYIFNKKKNPFLRLSCRGSGLGQLNQYISRDL